MRPRSSPIAGRDGAGPSARRARRPRLPLRGARAPRRRRTRPTSARRSGCRARRGSRASRTRPAQNPSSAASAARVVALPTAGERTSRCTNAVVCALQQQPALELVGEADRRPRSSKPARASGAPRPTRQEAERRRKRARSARYAKPGGATRRLMGGRAGDGRGPASPASVVRCVAEHLPRLRRPDRAGRLSSVFRGGDEPPGDRRWPTPCGRAR